MAHIAKDIAYRLAAYDAARAALDAAVARLAVAVRADTSEESIEQARIVCSSGAGKRHKLFADVDAVFMKHDPAGLISDPVAQKGEYGSQVFDVLADTTKIESAEHVAQLIAWSLDEGFTGHYRFADPRVGRPPEIGLPKFGTHDPADYAKMAKEIFEIIQKYRATDPNRHGE